MHITLLKQWNLSYAFIIGIARGCGWQHIGAYVNLGAYYVVGIPMAAILGFWLQLRGKGLWIGILTGAFCQTIMLSLITSCTNWEKQVCLHFQVFMALHLAQSKKIIFSMLYFLIYQIIFF